VQKEAERAPTAVVFDRRQVYRPFLESLNSIAPTGEIFDRGMIVPRDHDPSDLHQPPIHEALAHSAELNRGTQMALVGGIGSGKTTEILLTQRVLDRHADAVNIWVDMADYTDLNGLNPGAILATIGLRLYAWLKKNRDNADIVADPYHKLRKLAFPQRKWVHPDELEPDYDDEEGRWIETPGLMRTKFPSLRQEVKEVKELALAIASPLLEEDAQITFLIDGLDRLINAERFREFAEQDLRALRGTKITVIVVAPLLLLYDKSRFVQDYFDVVKHIPAAGPKDAAFLKEILERRGALELMNRPELHSIVRFSGGVIRDLLTLASTAAAYAYRDDQDKIGPRHVRAAINQLGNRYLAGLGTPQRRRLRRLAEDNEFRVDDPVSLELLVNRQILEQSDRGRESFAVHPALARVLPIAK
jgi:ABC-type dipeptide/oligopeptide/nickel transport system ATPase component